MILSLQLYTAPSNHQLMVGITEEDNIVWIDWYTGEKEQFEQINKHLKPSEYIFQETVIFNQLKKELDGYFNGTLKEFQVPIQLVGTHFQKRVWKALLAIPYGETVTYSEQSIKLGDLKAIRAVAKANGSNPISIIIPCHRVIGKNGSLTGYRGGISNKQFLLNHEALFSNKPVQGSLF